MKKALITGASGGIGFETARQLAQQNYQVTLVARNRDRLEKALSSLSGNGHTFLVADLNNAEDLQKRISALKSTTSSSTTRVQVLTANLRISRWMTSWPLCSSICRLW
jgi:short-subunit dehydrogenase